MKAEPSCNLQDILPVSFTARFAQVPRKMPKAVQTCHDMTKPPRILVGDYLTVSRRLTSHAEIDDGAASTYIFCRKYRYSDFLETHSNSEEDTCCNQLTPVLGAGRADGGEQREDGTDENGTTSTEPVIERVRYPSSTGAILGVHGAMRPRHNRGHTYKKAMAM